MWLREAQVWTWRRIREVGRSGRRDLRGRCLKWRRRGECCSGADKRGWQESSLRRALGKWMSGSGVCKETHGISAGARPLMIHNGIKEIKNHNNVNIHTKVCKGFVLKMVDLFGRIIFLS